MPEPLVLLSGMLGDATTWAGVLPGLQDVADPVHLGITDRDTVPALAAAVLEAAPPTFAVAGHSLGGIVALEVVRQAPDRVTRLALLNTSGRGPNDRQQASWRDLVARTAAGGFDDVATEMGRSLLPEPNRTDALVDTNVAMARAVGAEGFLRQLAAQAAREDLRPTLAAVHVPTLVLSGALDEVCRPHLQAELAEAVPGARHVVLEGVGHMAPLEAPAAVAAALRDWLTRPTDRPDVPDDDHSDDHSDDDRSTRHHRGARTTHAVS